MIVEFEPKGHVYSVNGEIATISVTELLAKHKLAPSYSGISKARLKASADKGKEVHKDLENILNQKDYEPTTEQGKQFAEWVKANLDCGVGEQVLGFEDNGFVIAGTADFMGILKNGTLVIGDHKNTSKFHREYVTWQVNLLDYFARKLGNEKINGNLLKWGGAKEFYCFHYDPKTCEMKIYELDKIDDCEIEKLIECERNGQIYQRPNLVIDNELREKFLLAEEQLVLAEIKHKQAELEAKKIREEILQAFEKQNIKSWESPNGRIKATYVGQQDSLVVDSSKLKSKYPQVWADCRKLSHKKAYIQIKVRGENEDEF